MLYLEIAFLILGCILSIVFVIIGIIHINKQQPIWTRRTNQKIKEKLEEEKKLYNEIHTEIKKAGVINRWILRRKLGPLYKWYEGGYL